METPKEKTKKSLKKEHVLGQDTLIEREVLENQVEVLENQVDALENQVEVNDIVEHESTPFSITGLIYIALSFVFVEVVTHWGTVHSIDSNIIFPIVFAAGLGVLISFITSVASAKVNTWIVVFLQMLFAIYCDVQMICYSAIGTYLRLWHIRDDMWLVKNSGQVMEAITSSLGWIVLMVLPIVFLAVIGRRFIKFGQSGILVKLMVLFGTIILALIGILGLNAMGYEADAPYNAFYNYESGVNTNQAGEQLGVTVLGILELVNHK